MSTLQRHVGLLVLLPLCAACDSSAGVGTLGGDARTAGVDAAVGSADGSTGTGSGTLSIAVTIQAEERTNNATVASDFNTEVSVEVSKQGAPIGDATVGVRTSAGSLTLVAGDPGEYTGAISGYPREFTIDVIAGVDRVEDVRVTGPAVHTISAPVEGASHPADQPLLVSWSPTGADQAEIETGELSRVTVPDNGSYTVDASFLAGEEGNLKGDRVRIWRATRTAIGGAVAGSTALVRVRNQVEFIVDGQ